MMFITWRTVMPLRAVSCIVAVGVLVPFIGSKTIEREFDCRLIGPLAGKGTLRSACASPPQTAAPASLLRHWLAAPVWMT